MEQFRVLVVGESAALRQQVRYILLQQNFIVLEAFDLQEGLKKLRQEPIHLIVVDIQFQFSSLVLFLSHVRRLQGGREVPLLLLREEKQLPSQSDSMPVSPAMSGRIEIEDIDFYYLTKPFSSLGMKAIVKKIFSDSLSSFPHYSQPSA